MGTRDRRVRKVEANIEALPLRHEAVCEAFEDFKMFGELPEHERLAQAVIDSALAGEVQTSKSQDRPSQIRMLLDEMQRLRNAETPTERTLRDYLLDHAGYAPPALRMPARLACTVLAARGIDLTDPKALADEPLPGHNGVGMHVLGYPDKLATEPYVAQAKRLFARYEAMRERTPNCGDAWFDEFGDATAWFRSTGELPDDELMRDAVLADVELEALVRHKAGHDVGELMAALDKAARIKGKARDTAIDNVRQLVVARHEAEQ